MLWITKKIKCLRGNHNWNIYWNEYWWRRCMWCDKVEPMWCDKVEPVEINK